MGELIYARKQDENGLTGDNHSREGHYSQAVVPTIDVYAAKVLFGLTQKMIEDTVDRRVSALEKNIERRDLEVMRTIRRIQAQVVIQQQNKPKSPLTWWKKLFKKR